MRKLLFIAKENRLNDIYSQKLKDSGYDIDCISHDFEMVEFNTYDFIIYDYCQTFPDQLSCLKKLVQLTETPVIAIASDINYDSIKAVLDVGISNFVLKPIIPDDFITKIKSLTSY